MKHTLLLVITLFLVKQTPAQLLFTEIGAVKYKNADTFALKKDTAFRYLVDSSRLRSWQESQRKKFQKELKTNLSISTENLKNRSDSFSLLKWLIGADSVLTLAKELDTIYKYLDSGSAKRINSSSILHPLAKAIDSIIRIGLFEISVNNPTARLQEYQLVQQDILSQFLTKYYSNVLTKNKDTSVAKQTLSDYYLYYNELKQQYDRINSLLQDVYKQAQPETLEQLYLSHQRFRGYRNSKYIKFLQQPFFSQWIWSTGGTLKLNPLDFSAARLMDTVPELDLLSRTFSKKEFIIRNNRLTDENKVSMQKLLYPARVTNRSRFPVGDAGSNQYFLLDAKEKDLEMGKLAPLDQKDKINLLLLNIDKGYTARYKTVSTEKLSGKSATEEIIDSATGTALKLFSLINPSISTIANIFNGLNSGQAKKPQPLLPLGLTVAFDASASNSKNKRRRVDKNVTVSFNSAQDGNEIVFPLSIKPVYVVDTFWTEMKAILKTSIVPGITDGDNTDLMFYTWKPIKEISFSDTIFLSVKKRYKKEAEDTVKKGSPNQLENLREKIIKNYLQKMYAQQIAPKIIDSLRQDSLYLAHLINLISFSSLPVGEIETAIDTVPRFQSVLLAIDDKDVNLERRIAVDRVNEKKDSVALVSFSYKRGKYRLVEISFGLGYTFQYVWTQNAAQNKVTSKDERFRGIAAAHFYPFRGKDHKHNGLYKIDEPFFGSWNRINFMVGVGVPKPLDHYYLGVGYDFGPGLKLNAGLHIQRYNQFKALNDQIISRDVKYKPLFPFVSFSLNPELVVNNILKLF